MTENIAVSSTDAEDEEPQVSLLAFATVLLRWRRVIIGLAFIGFVFGVTSALLSPRLYTSAATFVPQGSENSASGLSLAASQLGIRIPTTSGSGWGPAMYVELLRSRALLEPLVNDTVTVVEEHNRRKPVMDLLEIGPTNPERRKTLAVRALGGLVSPKENPKLSAVEVAVTTKWPSVSLQLAQRIVDRVNAFNIETRKSQATTELKFVEAQTQDAERALRQAEDRLQSFLQGNRTIGSPELSFDRDRLQREVTERQQLYTSWLQTREEARIRELRDTPVITVLEAPRLAISAESRQSVRKAMVGGMTGAIIGIVLAFLSHALAGAKRTTSPEAQEFFRLLKEATPRFLRRRMGW